MGPLREEGRAKECFVIAPIGEEGSDVRRRSDTILDYVIGPAVKECGYEAIRGDKLSQPGLITNQVINLVLHAPLAVADLSGRNANVFYEVALRHVARMPLIQLMAKGEQLPFDVAGMRAIPVDVADIKSGFEARDEIIRQIRATEDLPPEKVESPISAAIEFRALGQSEDAEKRSIANLISAVSSLKVEMDKHLADLGIKLGTLEQGLSMPEKILPPSYMKLITGDLFVRGTRFWRILVAAVQELLDKLNSPGVLAELSPHYDFVMDRARFIAHLLQEDSEIQAKAIREER